MRVDQVPRVRRFDSPMCVTGPCGYQTVGEFRIAIIAPQTGPKALHLKTSSSEAVS